MSYSLFAQKTAKRYEITGQVTDLNDQPLAGAIILVDNQSTSITTDSEGMYKVKVKAGARTISVFNPMNGQMEEEIGGRNVINFKLTLGISLPATEKQQSTSDEGDEIVDVGYGYASKKSMTTTVGKAEGGKKKFATYSSIFEMIKAEVSNVQVEGTKIYIRGINSINNTDPLFIVDGIVVPSIEDIRPSMVESITVLKGSDASIYGSRGANGVIMITMTGKK